jgi:hypothetical protein
MWIIDGVTLIAVPICEAIDHKPVISEILVTVTLQCHQVWQQYLKYVP